MRQSLSFETLNGMSNLVKEKKMYEEKHIKTLTKKKKNKHIIIKFKEDNQKKNERD